jgi:hypothetical protein
VSGNLLAFGSGGRRGLSLDSCLLLLLFLLVGGSSIVAIVVLAFAIVGIGVASWRRCRVGGWSRSRSRVSSSSTLGSGLSLLLFLMVSEI